MYLNKTYYDLQEQPQDMELLFAEKSEGREIKVLLLEDNTVNQILAVEMLAMLGIHNVHVAENGIEGLKKIEIHKYDLIVTDIKMPYMDGIEFTLKVREMENYKNIPIIAMTSNVKEEQVISYYNAGMNNCLMKPVDIRTFKKILGGYIY